MESIYKSDKGLLVSQKAQALLLRIYPRLINFPKSEKFVLSADIRQNFLDLIKFIEMANSVKSKRVVYAQQADGHLQTLKILIKIGRARGYFSKGQFRDYSLYFLIRSLIASSSSRDIGILVFLDNSLNSFNISLSIVFPIRVLFFKPLIVTPPFISIN